VNKSGPSDVNDQLREVEILNVKTSYLAEPHSCRNANRAFPAPARPRVYAVKPIGERSREQRAQRKWTPPANHPWRGAILNAQQKRELKAAAVAKQASLALLSASP